MAFSGLLSVTRGSVVFNPLLEAAGAHLQTNQLASALKEGKSDISVVNKCQTLREDLAVKVDSLRSQMGFSMDPQSSPQFITKMLNSADSSTFTKLQSDLIFITKMLDSADALLANTAEKIKKYQLGHRQRLLYEFGLLNTSIRTSFNFFNFTSNIERMISLQQILQKRTQTAQTLLEELKHSDPDNDIIYVKNNVDLLDLMTNVNTTVADRQFVLGSQLVDSTSSEVSLNKNLPLPKFQKPQAQLLNNVTLGPPIKGKGKKESSDTSSSSSDSSSDTSSSDSSDEDKVSSTYGASLHSEKSSFSAGWSYIPRMFLEKSPVGLQNQSNNCWMNSLWQLIMVSPGLQKAIQDLPNEPCHQNLKNGIAIYKESQGQQCLSKADKRLPENFSQSLRGSVSAMSPIVGAGAKPLHMQIREISPFSHVQVDTAEGLRCLLTHSNDHSNSPIFNTVVEYQVNPFNFTLIRHMTLPNVGFIPIDLYNHQQGLCFEEFLKVGFFRENGGGARKFEKPPQEIIFQLNRYTYVGAKSYKLENKINVPLKMTLGKDFIATGEEETYICKGFVEHRGKTPTSGHYVAYVLESDGTWSLCNDGTVTKVSEDNVKLKIRDNYCSYWVKI